MGKRYLIDTNAAIDFLNNRLPQKTTNLIYGAEMHMSVVTRMELLGSPGATREELKAYKNFIRASTVYDLDERIILKGIDVRKNYRLKLPDTIIAATALVNNFTLITRNVADFKKVPKLNILNPWE